MLVGDTVIWPDPLLVGRDPQRLRELAIEHGIERWSTDLDSCLSDPNYAVYFDAQTTKRREEAVRNAIRLGKHVYCEKPVATTTATALELAELAERWAFVTGWCNTSCSCLGLSSSRGSSTPA
jgi:Oxidoreductase family, NAD-binding Rossmann fold